MKYENLILWGRLESETVSTIADKNFIVDDVFTLLQEAYRNVKGGLHFENKETLLSKTAWMKP